MSIIKSRQYLKYYVQFNPKLNSKSIEYCIAGFFYKKKVLLTFICLHKGHIYVSVKFWCCKEEIQFLKKCTNMMGSFYLCTTSTPLTTNIELTIYISVPTPSIPSSITIMKAPPSFACIYSRAQIKLTYSFVKHYLLPLVSHWL